MAMAKTVELGLLRECLFFLVFGDKSLTLDVVSDCMVAVFGNYRCP